VQVDAVDNEVGNVKHHRAVMIAGILTWSASAVASASAQNLTLGLEADVMQMCGAFNGQTSAVEVDFGALANTPIDRQLLRRAGSITYRCNNRNGFTRSIASQNGGYMTLNGEATNDAARRIPFTMSQSGANGFAQRQLTTPMVTSHRDGVTSARLLRGSGGNVSFRASGVRTPTAGGAPAGTRVFAGTYRDTVTITITAN
jgi:spore coat protein U-like protein